MIVETKDKLSEPAPSRSWLALAAGLSLGVGLWATPLFDPDEPVYAQAGLEMSRHHSWLVPWFSGRPWFDKPVLFYSLERASQDLLGAHALAARLPSVLAGLGLGALLLAIGRRWYSPGAGRWAAWMALTAIYPAVVARAAVTDTLFVLTLTLGWFGLGELLRRPGWSGAGLAALGAGLAVLTKGPVALVLLGLAGIFYLGARRTLRPLADPRIWVAFLGAVALAGPWYLLMQRWFPLEFAREFLGQQNLGRFTVSEHGPRPAWYYLLAAPLALLPWTAFLPVLRRASGPAASDSPGRFHPGAWSACWGAAVFGFFSLSATKLPTYILPAFPALFLVLGAGLARSGPGWRRAARGVGLASALAVALAAWFVAPRLVCYYSAASRMRDLRQIPQRDSLFIYHGRLPGTLYYAGRRGLPVNTPTQLDSIVAGPTGSWLLVRPGDQAELRPHLEVAEKLPSPAGPWGEGIALYHFAAPRARTGSNAPGIGREP